MATVTFRHTFDCGESTFWSRCMFDKAFNKTLYLQVLRFNSYVLKDQKEDASLLVRQVYADPPSTMMPEAIKELVGADFSYIENGVFDKKTGRYTFTCRSNAMPKEVQNSGEVWVEKLGERKVERIARVNVDVDVLIVGSMIEDSILKDLHASYEATADFTHSFIKAEGLDR